MAQPLTENAFDWRNIAQTLITEDDEPVDNLISAKQQRLLVESLYSSWQPAVDEEIPDVPRPFLADANVGIFYARYQPPIVPDVFVSLDIEVNPAWLADEHRAYFVWEFGKVPEIAIEIVSNRVGGELTKKLDRYARMGLIYYAIFDPFNELGDERLRVYELFMGRRYRLREDWAMPELSLGLMLWQGTFEGLNGEWLRWRDKENNLLLTGKESSILEAVRANQEAARANQEAARANQEAARADQETARADQETAARQLAEDEIARLRAEMQLLQHPAQ